jgi:N-acetylglucosamine kinase-like BadF-type ATPase
VEERQLTAALRTRAWGPDVEVRNDTFAILRAGATEPRGVAVVCGAGINCVGMRPDGRTARFPALGRISGDWGGGWGLAEEALWHAARAEDGRGVDTELARVLPAHFGLPSMYALIEALHLEDIAPVRRHELTPVLFATAAAGDPVARSLVDRLADEVVSMATVALTRLDLLDEETPVLLGGSVLAARHPELDDGVRELLAARAPKAVPRVVTASPVLGAALLGLDRTGAPPEVQARVRAYYEA